jgi:hypothetical protein
MQALPAGCSCPLLQQLHGDCAALCVVCATCLLAAEQTGGGEGACSRQQATWHGEELAQQQAAGTKRSVLRHAMEHHCACAAHASTAPEGLAGCCPGASYCCSWQASCCMLRVSYVHKFMYLHTFAVQLQRCGLEDGCSQAGNRSSKANDRDQRNAQARNRYVQPGDQGKRMTRVAVGHLSFGSCCVGTEGLLMHSKPFNAG